MKLFQTNSIEMCEPVKRVLVLKFPVFCLKKRKTRYVFSCVKLMSITCDKKIDIVNIFIYSSLFTT